MYGKGIKKDFKGVSLTKFDYPDWHCLGFSVKNNLRLGKVLESTLKIFNDRSKQ